MDAVDRFQVLAAAALMDGTIGPAEKETLLKAAKELGIKADAAEKIIKETKSGGKGLAARIPSDPRNRATFFRSLVDVVAADGVIDARELKLFQRLGPAFGLNELEVEDLLRGAAEAKKSSSQRLKKQ